MNNWIMNNNKATVLQYTDVFAYIWKQGDCHRSIIAMEHFPG